MRNVDVVTNFEQHFVDYVRQSVAHFGGMKDVKIVVECSEDGYCQNYVVNIDGSTDHCGNKAYAFDDRMCLVTENELERNQLPPFVVD